MKKILVPTDFSKNANIATAVAADIARRSGAELVLLHIIEEVSGGSFNVEGQVNLDGDMEEKLFTLALIKKARAAIDAGVDHLYFHQIGDDQEGFCKAWAAGLAEKLA